MKPKSSIEWKPNERPVKLWRILDLIMAASLILVVVVEITVWFLLEAMNPVLASVYYLLPFLGGGLWLYLRLRMRRIWPAEVGLSERGVHLRFSSGEERLLSWGELGQVRLIGPESPSIFGLLQSVLYRVDGSRVRADIYGDAARALKSQFDEHFGKSG